MSLSQPSLDWMLNHSSALYAEADMAEANSRRYHYLLEPTSSCGSVLQALSHSVVQISVFSFGPRWALGFRIQLAHLPSAARNLFLQPLLGPFLSDTGSAWSVFLSQMLELFSTLNRTLHLSQVWWRGSEHTTPKYVTLAYQLFWAECPGVIIFH